ncbi:hypothetical protein ACYULU_14055 [Breznakiellaceae bacterium SP9]
MAVNYSVNDFSPAEDLGIYRKYILNDNCIIFDKIYEEPLHILIDKKLELVNFVPKISEYKEYLVVIKYEFIINWEELK